MKNIFSKMFSVVAVVLITAGFVLPINQAQAASFNGDALDVKTLKIANSTVDRGTYNWQSTATANAGEEIAFLVYYHNSSNETAQNTRVRINLPSGSQTTHTITTNIWAGNAQSISDFATLTLSSSQTLSFMPGTVKWYPNQGTASQSLPSGQSGDEIISFNGLNLGNIAKGWSSQGYITVKARVSGSPVNNTQAPIVTTNSASNVSGNFATLNALANPNNAQTSVWFDYGTSSNTFTNTSATLNIGSGNSATDLSLSVSNLSANTTYYFRAVAQNANGTSYGNTLSFVTPAQQNQNLVPSVITYAASDIFSGAATLNALVNPNSASTTARFEYGTSSNSLGYTSQSISVGSGNSAISVPVIVSGLSANTTYYLRAVASNNAGTSYGSVLSFTTSQSNQNLAPGVNTYAATNISQNLATLNYGVNPYNSPTSVWLQYGTSSGALVHNSQTVSVSAGNNYINNSINVSGLSANTTYYFRAAAQNSYGTNYGNTLLFVTSGTQQNTFAPSVTTNAATAITATSANLNSTVNPNGSVGSTWFEYGTSQSNLNKTTVTKNFGNEITYISITIPSTELTANTAYYFRPVAQNGAGKTYGAVNSFTTNKTTTTVVTNTSLPFIEISQSVANLTSPNGSQTSNFANIGDKLTYSIALKNTGVVAGSNFKTTAQLPNTLKYMESSPKATFDAVSGILTWNTARLRSQESAALSFTVEVVGGLNSTIQMQSQTYIPVKNLNVFSNTTSTIISLQKPVSLKFTVDQNEVKAGELLKYTITIKNINKYDIKNALFSIGLPEHTELQEADFSVASKSENNLIVDAGNITAGNEIVKTFSVKVATDVDGGDILTAIALVNYQDASGNIQPVVSASASSTVSGSANLAASIFGGIASFSLVDWLTLFGILIFILVVIYTSRSIARRMKARNQEIV